MHRGAANLRLAATESALTIPPRTTRLHRLLEGDVIYPLIAANAVRTKRDLMPLLQRLVEHSQLPRPMFEEINRSAEGLVDQALVDVLAIPMNVSPEQLRIEELAALQHAAAHGAPPRAAATPGSAEAFSVYQEDVRFITRGRLIFRITPINRLRVVMVQKGYKRIDETGDEVSVHYPKTQSRWLPGVELLGEGLFIDLVDSEGNPVRPPLGGPDADTWRRAVTVDTPQRRPAHVWWHTLSHRLITAISIDSGYSAAAIRERVYASSDSATDSIGGILLYTAQPGGDGTFGGMIALADRFAEILEDALEYLPRCSNDPLCAEQKFDPSKANGAACYACEFVSETSCECRNMFLDRNVLLANLP